MLGDVTWPGLGGHVVLSTKTTMSRFVIKSYGLSCSRPDLLSLITIIIAKIGRRKNDILMNGVTA